MYKSLYEDSNKRKKEAIVGAGSKEDARKLVDGLGIVSAVNAIADICYENAEFMYDIDKKSSDDWQKNAKIIDSIKRKLVDI